MKKLLTAVLLMLSVSAFAQHFHHHRGYYGPRYYDRGGWVAPLIGGVIVGAVITEAAKANTPPAQPPVVIQQPVPQSTYSCLVQVYDPVTRTIKNEVMICVNQ